MLSQPTPPPTETVQHIDRFDQSAQELKKLLTASQPIIESFHNNVALQNEQKRTEQEETKKALAKASEDNQAIFKVLTQILAAYKIAEENQKKLTTGILEICKQKNVGLEKHLTELEELYLNQQKAINEHLPIINASLANHKINISDLQNIFIPNIQKAHQREVDALKQEITFIKIIGLGITSLAFFWWLWTYTHRA